MRRSLVLILLVAVGFCGSNRLECEIFNPSEKELRQYCEGFNGIAPKNCSNDSNSMSDWSQVNRLKIHGCDPEFVTNSAKRFQEYLGALDLSYSAYKNLESFDVNFHKVQVFNASHNQLTYLSWYFFLQFPEVVEIDLSYNSILRVSHNLIELPKLKKLHLSHNNFAFADMQNIPLQSIDYIDLRNNQIGFLFRVRYNQYKVLEELHLEENPYHRVDSDVLEGMFNGRLDSLFLTWKNVDRFQGVCSDDCRVKRMRIIRVDDTSNEGIFYTSNGIFEMRCKDKCFENVFLFDAGHNNFENGSDVIRNIGASTYGIDLSGNFIGELSAGTFERFGNLHRLGLSATNLTWFDLDMLWKQEDKISKLDISNNNLKELRNIPSLRKYKLRELIIGGNQIENAYEIIENLDESIEILDLSGGNNVGKLNENAFQRLIGLKQLNLSSTNLVLPNSNPFEKLHNLESLDLSHNNLENVNLSMLSATFHNLAELFLADCRIKDVITFGTVIQYLGPNLSKLDLSRNAAHGTIDSSSFNLNTLRHQQKLTSLDISYNELRTVDFKSFPFDEYITINLEGNDLTDLTDFPKRNSKWPWTTLKLANNQFPCLYIKQLKKDHDGEIYLAGEAWQQKSDRDCRSSSESVQSFLSNVYDTIKFW